MLAASLHVALMLATLTDRSYSPYYAVPDAEWGEIGRAHLVAATGRTLRAEPIAEWLSTRLARYKQPRSFIIETELPRTASDVYDASPPLPAAAPGPARPAVCSLVSCLCLLVTRVVYPQVLAWGGGGGGGGGSGDGSE